ncbi:putative AlkP superfamily pyrophosphatase or phosphodiesterase [Paucibacter oligotrophus]|uniref:Putative AlkP superfamily pyrophosphatase or phosphodiesterase n=1 Tax=Roseateles oligotrophus TaxID=1769250 RepID=A0A840L4W9_9BURK|nr:alkaline phosphatase family protein [Roseateles oligotrophus]MBB4843250.1 putative AlkP superfamily pyrophosphatase or phosphodiesterase [Roseateles oligotrophus]
MSKFAPRILSTLPLAFALLGCSSTPSLAPMPVAGAAAQASRPKLIVFMVVDGLPMRQVLAYRDQLQPDGFKRFLDRGAWFANAHYGHGHTVTAAGHSVMLSGAYPQRSGIISNEWRDPASGEAVYCTSDAAYSYIDNKTEPLAGTSPRNLKVETVGDVLRTVDPASKVIAVSGKDRGAILPAGHKGVAYMYMGATGQFASSTYYMASHPQWVKDFNAAKPADAFFGKAWAPLLPEAAYARSVPDGQSWQYTGGNGNKLPAVLGDKHEKPGPLFYGNILPSPFGDELTLAFARAALEGEQLGVDEKTDILSVSLSSHDYVNHAFGPESRLSHDHFLHLDRYLQGFFQYLDGKVGAANYMVVLTADHGFADTPEWAKSQGRDAERLNPSQMMAWVNTGLVKKFGEGRWATAFSAAGILFDQKLIAQKGLQPEAVYAETKALLLQLPGVADAFTEAQLRGDDRQTPYLAAMRKSWDPQRAAPVQVVVKPGWLFGSRVGGSSHGTPYAYDTHVPILGWGPAWLGQGEVKTPVEVADIAPTLAKILQVRAPAQAQGQVLPLPLMPVAAPR